MIVASSRNTFTVGRNLKRLNASLEIGFVEECLLSQSRQRRQLRQDRIPTWIFKTTRA